jgi:DNA-binding CsgD family transcriptional regulator
MYKKGYNLDANYFLSKNQQHMQFLESLGLGTFLFDYSSGRFHYMSDSAARAFSADKMDLMLSGINGLLDRVFEEDAQRILRLTQKAYDFIKTLSDSQRAKCELRMHYRVLRKDKGFYWLSQTNRVVRMEDSWFEFVRVSNCCEEQVDPPLYLELVYGSQRKCINLEADSSLASSLSKREEEVLFWSVRAHSISQIADLLNIGSAGVRFHRKNILKKLGMKNFIQVSNLYRSSQAMKLQA